MGEEDTKQDTAVLSVSNQPRCSEVQFLTIVNGQKLEEVFTESGRAALWKNKEVPRR